MLSNYKINFCLFLFGCLSQYGSAQIINIEKERIRNKADSVRWSGSASAGFNVRKNVATLVEGSTDLHLQYRKDKNLLLLLSQINYLQVLGEPTFERSAFLHLRYNRTLASGLRWELFTQAQNNLVTRVRLRGLLGTGLRYKLVQNPQFLLYIGSAYMYEYTEELPTKTEIDYLREHRSSSYLNLSWQPNSRVILNSTTYFQPRLDDFRDFRFAGETRLKVKITTRFALSAALRFTTDTQPAKGAPRDTYNWTNGFSYDF